MANFEEPLSRNEAILQNMLGANNALPEPESRIEDLLQQILNAGGGGGGEGTDAVARALINSLKERLSDTGEWTTEDRECAWTTYVANSIRNANTGKTYGNDPRYSHAFYDITPGATYYVTAGTSSNGELYPAVAFIDGDGATVAKYGTEKLTKYEDLEVIAPSGSVQMVVNNLTSIGVDNPSVKVRVVVATGVGAVDALAETLAEVAGRPKYDLNIGDALTAMMKKNPATLGSFDGGYISFVFDDLWNDVDSVASIFEEHNAPLCLAAIPDRLQQTCNGLSETRGNFTPGMTKQAVCEQVVANGGEILTHNSSPVVTAENQYDYDFMYSYFVGTKDTLRAAGFRPRGIIRAGGTGAITRSTEIQRWLSGQYEYSNMGTVAPHTWDRITINQPLADLKTAIDNAVANKQWICIMAHSYTYGDYFSGEADLEAILDYCETAGITIKTVGAIMDEFARTATGHMANAETTGM